MTSVPPPYSSRDHAQGKSSLASTLALHLMGSMAHPCFLHSSAWASVEQRIIKLPDSGILRNHFSLPRMENHWSKVDVRGHARRAEIVNRVC